MSVSTLSSIAQVIVAVAALVASATLALVAYLASRRIARIEFERWWLDAWASINALALSSDKMLKAADKVMSHEARDDENLEAVRRKWFTYSVLNAISTTYIGAREGLTRSKSDAIDSCAYHLEGLLEDDDVYQLTQVAYNQDFARFCREVRSGSYVRGSDGGARTDKKRRRRGLFAPRRRQPG